MPTVPAAPVPQKDAMTSSPNPSPDAIRTEVVDGVLVITINRQHRRNALDRATAVLLYEALTELEDTPDLRVGVLTGAGGNFSAGMDLKAFADGERPVVGNRGFGGLVAAPPSKPLVAAVEGWALGGGLEMVLACDLVVAAEDARFGLPEVARGLVARGGGLVRLPRLLPHAIAMEAILTGRPFDAATARHHGLVNRICAPGKALEEAVDLARQVAGNAPLAVMASKRVAMESRVWGEAEWDALQDVIVAPVFSSDDAKEGAKAFMEKREPVWTGR